MQEPIQDDICTEEGKRSYSKRQAQTVVNNHKKRKRGIRSPKKIPIRIYPCSHCNGWHVTSQKNT